MKHRRHSRNLAALKDKYWRSFWHDLRQLSSLLQKTPHWSPGNDVDHSRLRTAKYGDFCYTLKAGKNALATRDHWQLQCRNDRTLSSDAVWPIQSADQNAQQQSYGWGAALDHPPPLPWHKNHHKQLKEELQSNKNFQTKVEMYAWFVSLHACYSGS
jgi:hypothetical protein